MEGRLGTRWLAISGFAAGALVATKVVMAAVIWPLAVWIALVSWQRDRIRGVVLAAFAWGSPIAAWAVGIGIYNQVRFGSALATGYGGESMRFETPLLVGLAGLLISPAKGIVWYCPAILLGAIGVARALRRSESRLAWAVVAMTVCLLLIFAKYYQWYGGGAWGPRFLVPLLPLWLAFAASALSAARAGGWAPKVGVGAVLALALAGSAAGVLVPFDRDPELIVGLPREMRAVMWRIERSPIVANLAELPRGLALTISKLVETDDRRATGEALTRSAMPDFAFVRYGSHALLNWTRAGLLLGAGLLAAAAALAVRAQKAFESRPPQ
jgi:hypothetical protein